MAKITYNTSPYTDDADLPHSPAAEPGADKICINCGNSFVTGVLLSKAISPYCDNCSPQATHHCPGCEAAARELADLRSDKAWADKLAAENADELSNLRREHDDLRAGILRVIEDYPRDIKQDAEEALRTLADGVAAPVSSNSDLRARLAAEAAEWRTEARYDKTAADIFDACADAVERIIAETEAK